MTWNLLLTICFSALSASVPVLMAGMGGLFTYHVNVFNISLEGMLLTGAFCAVCGSLLFKSWALGMLFGIAGSMVIALIFAFCVLQIRMGEFITGIAINTFVTGATTYFLRQLFNVKGTLMDPGIVNIPKWDIPILRDIPILGNILNHHPWPLYMVLFLLFPLVYVVLYKSRFGIRLRATGYDSRTLDSVGVRSNTYKFIAILLSGFCCGIGGSYLSIGYMKLFSENMSNGRGWIAIAIILLTKGKPFKILLLGLLFGLFEGIGMSLQAFNIPTQFTYMLPYVSTLVALFIDSRQKKKKAIV